LQHGSILPHFSIPKLPLASNYEIFVFGQLRLHQTKVNFELPLFYLKYSKLKLIITLIKTRYNADATSIADWTSIMTSSTDVSVSRLPTENPSACPFHSRWRLLSEIIEHAPQFTPGFYSSLAYISCSRSKNQTFTSSEESNYRKTHDFCRVVYLFSYVWCCYGISPESWN
jgi:hypothetical protein